MMQLSFFFLPISPQKFNLGENLTSFWSSFSLDPCKVSPVWHLPIVLHEISLQVTLLISFINSAIISVWMTFKSLSLPDLLPSIPAKSRCVLLTSLCGCLTFSSGYYHKGSPSSPKGKFSVLSVTCGHRCHEIFGLSL